MGGGERGRRRGKEVLAVVYWECAAQLYQNSSHTGFIEERLRMVSSRKAVLLSLQFHYH